MPCPSLNICRNSWCHRSNRTQKTNFSWRNQNFKLVIKIYRCQVFDTLDYHNLNISKSFGKKGIGIGFQGEIYFWVCGGHHVCDRKNVSEKKSYLFYDCHPVFNFQSNWTPFCLKPTWPLRPFVSKSTQYKVSFYPHYLWEVKAKRHLAYVSNFVFGIT